MKVIVSAFGLPAFAPPNGQSDDAHHKKRNAVYDYERKDNAKGDF